jgi:hypothetical protein
MLRVERGDVDVDEADFALGGLGGADMQQDDEFGLGGDDAEGGLQGAGDGGSVRAPPSVHGSVKSSSAAGEEPARPPARPHVTISAEKFDRMKLFFMVQLRGKEEEDVRDDSEAADPRSPEERALDGAMTIDELVSRWVADQTAAGEVPEDEEAQAESRLLARKVIRRLIATEVLFDPQAVQAGAASTWVHINPNVVAPGLDA